MVQAAIQIEMFPAAGGSAPTGRYPSQPGFKVHGASEEAARHVAGAASRLRADVLAELRRWPAGRTSDEIAIDLRRSPLSVRPRMSELKAMAKIAATGERRR